MHIRYLLIVHQIYLFIYSNIYKNIVFTEKKKQLRKKHLMLYMFEAFMKVSLFRQKIIYIHTYTYKED